LTSPTKINFDFILVREAADTLKFQIKLITYIM